MQKHKSPPPVVTEVLKAVVFDFDGVICDSEPLHHASFMRVFEPKGFVCDYERYLNELVGFDDRDLIRFAIRELEGEQAAESISEALMQSLIEEKATAFEACVEEGIEPTNGLIPFIEEVSKTVPIAIASGATHRDINLLLDALSLKSYFQIIVAADDVDRSKPDPETYRLAVHKLAQAHPALNLQPGDCVTIEDTDAGLTSASLAGLRTIGLTTTGPAELLTKAERVAADFTDLNMAKIHAWFSR